MLLGLHLGIQHADFGGYEGTQRSGGGPRFELEAEASYRGYVGIAAVAGLAHYRDYDPYRDPLVGYRIYEERETHLFAGGRLYFRPHPRLFVGVGVLVDHYTNTFIDTRGPASFDKQTIVFEPVIGGVLGQLTTPLGRADVVALGTFASWDAPEPPFTEHIYALQIGLAQRLR